MTQGLKKLTYCLGLLLVISCGKKRDENDNHSGNDPNLPLTAAEQLVGEWIGIYRALDGSKPVGEPSEVTVKFDVNHNLTLLIPGNAAARLEGHWQEFQGKSLIISVISSTMPRIGSAGKLIETPYELLGSSLLIGNDTFEIKTSKKNQGESSSPGLPATGIWGQWICDGGNRRRTTIKLWEPGEFTLTSSSPGERLFLAKGTVVADSTSDIRLNPTAVSDPLDEGGWFQMTGGGDKAQLIYKSNARAAITLGSCKH